MQKKKKTRKHVGCLGSSKELSLTGEDSTRIEEDVIVKTGKNMMDRDLNTGQGVEYCPKGNTELLKMLVFVTLLNINHAKCF